MRTQYFRIAYLEILLYAILAHALAISIIMGFFRDSMTPTVKYFGKTATWHA